MDTLKTEYESPQKEGAQCSYSTMFSSSSSSSLSSGSSSPKEHKTFRNWMVEADNETAEDKSFSSDLESSLPSPSNLPFFPRKRRESRKERRARTTFTSQQTQVLEVEYRRSEYISRPRRYELATQLNLKEVQIKIWYQNRRAKDKRIEKASWDRQYRCLGLMAVAAAGQFPAAVSPSSSVNYRQLLANNTPPHPLLFPTSPNTTLPFPFPFLAQMQMAATRMPSVHFGDKEKLKAN